MTTARRAAITAAIVAAAGATALAVWATLPLPASPPLYKESLGVVIQDRNGLTLRATRGDDGSRSSWVPYDAIDPDLINAFVAVEDRRFWDHHGVDVRAVARAAFQNLRARHVVSGASTITMQLARLLRPGERSWTSKLSQAVWAL